MECLPQYTDVLRAMFTPIGLNHHVSLSYCNGIVRTQNYCVAVAEQIPDSARETPISTIIIVRVNLMFSRKLQSRSALETRGRDRYSDDIMWCLGYFMR